MKICTGTGHSRKPRTLIGVFCKNTRHLLCPGKNRVVQHLVIIIVEIMDAGSNPVVAVFRKFRLKNRIQPGVVLDTCVSAHPEIRVHIGITVYSGDTHTPILTCKRKYTQLGQYFRLLIIHPKSIGIGSAEVLRAVKTGLSGCTLFAGIFRNDM